MSLIQKNRFSFRFALTALLLLPTGALAQDSASQEGFELSYKDARALFTDFGASATDDSATLKGLYPLACKDHFKVSVRPNDKAKREDFVIQAKDSLRACIEKFQKDHPDARAGDSKLFGRLSKLHGASIQAGDRDIRVGMAWLDEESDPAIERRQEFSPAIQYVSEKTLERHEKDSRNAQLDKDLKECDRVARNSRGTEEDELEALAALRLLVQHERIDESEADSIRESIYSDRMKRLRESVTKAKIEDFKSIDGELLALSLRVSSDDVKTQNSIADLRMQLVDRITRQNPADVEASEHALSVVQGLADSSRVSKDRRDGASARVPQMRGNVVAAQLASSAIAQMGYTTMGSNQLQVESYLRQQPELIQYYQELQMETQSSCQAFQSSKGRDREAAGKCQRAQALLATEPNRVVSVSSAAIMKTINEQAAAIQKQAAAGQPAAQPAPVQPVQQQVPFNPNAPRQQMMPQMQQFPQYPQQVMMPQMQPGMQPIMIRR